MDALWDAGEAMTPRVVQTTVSTSSRPLAYTTVMTILVRLWKKGMVQREERGRSFAYRPTSGRDEWAARRMQEILERSSDPAATLSHFVHGISADDMKKLRRSLDEGERR